MGEEDQLHEHCRDAQEGEVDRKFILEGFDVLTHLEQPEQPDQSEEAQEAKHAHLLLLALEQQIKQFDGHA